MHAVPLMPIRLLRVMRQLNENRDYSCTRRRITCWRDTKLGCFCAKMANHRSIVKNLTAGNDAYAYRPDQNHNNQIAFNTRHISNPVLVFLSWLHPLTTRPATFRLRCQNAVVLLSVDRFSLSRLPDQAIWFCRYQPEQLPYQPVGTGPGCCPLTSVSTYVSANSMEAIAHYWQKVTGTAVLSRVNAVT